MWNKEIVKMEQIKITINGRELTGSRGETILNIAAANGIEIPNLCYNSNEIKNDVVS